MFTDPGFSRGLTVDPRAGDPSPLRRRDVIIAIQGIPIDRWLGNAGGRTASLRAGTALDYRVLRDGETVEVSVRLRNDRGLMADRLRDRGSPLGALVVLLVGAYTVSRRPEHPAARALLLLGAGLTAYDVFGVVSADAAGLVTARWLFILGVAGTFAGLAIWSTAAAHLALTFPVPVTALRRRPWLIAALYATALGSPVAMSAYLTSGRATLAGLGRIHTAFLVVLNVLVALTLAGLLRTIIRAPHDATTRRQGGLVVLGMGTTLTILLVANLVAGDSAERWPFWFDAVAFLPFAAALAAAIARGEFLDIRATINRAFVYTSLTGVLLGLFAAAVTVMGAVVGGSGLARTLPATALVAVAFAPARARVQRAVGRLLYG
ncbi:MAG: hypothetical protein ACREME_08760, partial [Gemmatimonadales bacterium]